MNNHSAEDYLDKLLNSVNGEEVEDIEDVQEIEDVADIEDIEDIQGIEDIQDVENIADIENVADESYMDEELSPFSDDFLFMDKTTKSSGKQMVSRRVSKSEADFLMEFEAELEGDDFDDFLKHFDDDDGIVPEDRLDDADVFAQDPFSTMEENPMMAAMPEMEDLPEIDDLPEMDEDPMMDAIASLSEMAQMQEKPMMEETPDMEDVPDMGEVPAMEEATESVSLEDMFFSNDTPENESDSFSLGGVDLGALLSETTEETPLMETSAMDAPTGEMSEEDAALADFFGSAGGDATSSDDDVFANLFGDESSGDSIDLSNMGEADLMSLLSGDGGLSDIGDMLSQEESGEIPIDGMDAFSAFAENEMAAQGESVETPDVKKGTKEKKGGFLGKISNILSGLMGGDDEDEEEPVALKKASAPSATELSGENDDILASLDALEEKPSGKKEKKKKEKKEKKEKKPKEKKPKKEKAPKPKKEKKPKEVDNTPPLPRGPVILIWLMVGSLFALVLLGVNLTGYASAISNAKSLLNEGEYAAAFSELDGITVKEKDMMLYNQVATLAPVDSELNAYHAFVSYERYEEALDSLVCAAGRVDINEDGADVYECIGQMEILKKEVSNELEQKFNMTYEEALEIYRLRDREEYTIALYEKLEELGLIEE